MADYDSFSVYLLFICSVVITTAVPEEHDHKLVTLSNVVLQPLDCVGF